VTAVPPPDARGSRTAGPGRGRLGALVAALVLLAAPADGQLYRWTDGDGTVHYTTDVLAIPPAYRDHARDIGAPTPGPVLEPPPPAAAAGVAIPYTGGPLVVDASLNGVPLRLLLDTGADRTLISPDAMTRAGYNTAGGVPIHIRGVTGDAIGMLVPVARLDVAGTGVGPVAVVVHALPGQAVDGLLGRDVLDSFSLTVDAASRRAILVPR